MEIISYLGQPVVLEGRVVEKARWWRRNDLTALILHDERDWRHIRSQSEC